MVTSLHPPDQYSRFVIPQFLPLGNVAHAVYNQLVGNFREELGHVRLGVVVARDLLHHFDIVQQCRQRLGNLLSISCQSAVHDEQSEGETNLLSASCVNHFHELVESRQIFDVVLGFIRSICDFVVEGAPIFQGPLHMLMCMPCLSQHPQHHLNIHGIKILFPGPVQFVEANTISQTCCHLTFLAFQLVNHCTKSLAARSPVVEL